MGSLFSVTYVNGVLNKLIGVPGGKSSWEESMKYRGTNTCPTNVGITDN